MRIKEAQNKTEPSFYTLSEMRMLVNLTENQLLLILKKGIFEVDEVRKGRRDVYRFNDENRQLFAMTSELVETGMNAVEAATVVRQHHEHPSGATEYRIVKALGAILEDPSEDGGWEALIVAIGELDSLTNAEKVVLKQAILGKYHTELNDQDKGERRRDLNLAKHVLGKAILTGLILRTSIH